MASLAAPLCLSHHENGGIISIISINLENLALMSRLILVALVLVLICHGICCD